MGHASPGLIFAFALAIVLVSLVFMVGFIGLTYGYVNRRMREWVPDSPRRESVLRWNFWTAGLASTGGLVRIALRSGARFDAAQSKIQLGVRLMLGLPLLTMLGYLATLALTGVVETVEMTRSFSILAMLAQLPGIWVLSRSSEIEQAVPRMAAAARMTIGLLPAAIGCLTLVFMAPRLPAAWMLLAIPFFAGFAYFGVRCFVQYAYVVLFAVLEAQPHPEGDQHRPGGLNTFVGIVYFVAASLIGLASAPATSDWPKEVPEVSSEAPPTTPPTTM